jgi:hypothetical protein
VTGAAKPNAVRWCVVAFLLIVVWAGAPASARAQIYIGQDIPHGGNFEIGGGIAWLPGSNLGSASAEETRNPGTGTGPFVLFSTDSRTTAAAGLQGRFGGYLSRSVSLEAGVLFSRPELSTRLTGDAESAPELTATETLTRFVLDGSALFHLTGLSFGGGRGIPFLSGGGGYLRDLHEKNELAETGHEFHFGGGLHYWFGQGKHRVGVRTDFGVSRRSGGADAVDTARTIPVIAGSIAYLF